MLQSSYTSKTSGRSHPLITVGQIRIRRQEFSILYLLPRTIAYTATEQVHQQILGDRIRCRRLIGIRIREGRLDRTRSPPKAIGLHAIGSAAVQLCPDGDPKVIRLLSESFLAGVKGDRTRSSSQYSRPTAVHSLQRSHQLKLRRLNVRKEMQLPQRLSDCYSTAI